MRSTPMLALVLAAACADGPGPSDSSCFLAFDAQVAGFRSWTSFSFDGGTEDASVHVAGPCTEYINELPPHASTAFPVGTIIVKEVGANDPANHHLFTMVKRGCDFNAGGAVGWEFMEIQEGTTTSILWRGVGPPAGENYGGDPNGCNGCHAACSDNDSVCSSSVRLSSF